MLPKFAAATVLIGLLFASEGSQRISLLHAGGPLLHLVCPCTGTQLHFLSLSFFLLSAFSQIQVCYTRPDCDGDILVATTARECCVETENGTSFGEPGNCVVSQCIGKRCNELCTF